MISKEQVPQRKFEADVAQIVRNIYQSTRGYGEQVNIYNIKGELAGLKQKFQFLFDYLLPTYPPTLLEIKTGKPIRNFHQNIRYLAAKARLLRYNITDEGDIFPQPIDYKLILCLIGDFGGPSYDSFRYLKLLRWAGWHILDGTNIKKIKKELETIDGLF